MDFKWLSWVGFHKLLSFTSDIFKLDFKLYILYFATGYLLDSVTQHFASCSLQLSDVFSSKSAYVIARPDSEYGMKELEAIEEGKRTASLCRRTSNYFTALSFLHRI